MPDADPTETTTLSFPVGLDAGPGGKLFVTPHDDNPMGRYDVTRSGKHAGAILVGGPDSVARLLCADSDWRVQKQHRRGWDLLIDSADGLRAGRYAARKWVAGGAITLSDGAQFVLRRRLNRLWKLWAADHDDPVLELRASGIPAKQRVTVSVRFRPPGSPEQSSLVVLTACTVVLLDRATGYIPHGS